MSIVAAIAIGAGALAVGGRSDASIDRSRVGDGPLVQSAVSLRAADGTVLPDDAFRDQLSRAGFSSRGWTTDFSLHTVPLTEISSGGPGKDGIPSSDKPKFIAPDEARDWLDGREPVIALEINGEARAYPLQILIWHEIVNDVVGDVPVTVTYCPLCNSAIVFEGTLNGVVHDFGATGNLRFSDLVMYDRQTETWWQQFTGEGIAGELAGKALTLIPSSLISFDDFTTAYSEGVVLSRDTGFSRSYGQIPYVGYDDPDNAPFLFRGDLDRRLPSKERVAVVTITGVDIAFPFTVLERERVVNYSDGEAVVFFKPGTLSALDTRRIEESRDVGSTGIFDARLDGRKLTFRPDGDRFVDNETGTAWNVVGHAIDGPLEGSQLTPIVHGNHFWFAWGVFKPDTKIYRGLT